MEGGGGGGSREAASVSDRRRPHLHGRSAVRSGRSRRSDRAGPGDWSDVAAAAAADDPERFPPLPPVGQMKHAICRQKVCDGISYALPVDKTRNSVENVFRTDLRVMFTDPYRSRMRLLRPGELRSLARHHFEPNSAQTPYDWTVDVPYRLNADSEQARRNYSRSAPAGRAADRKAIAEKPRSLLFVPVTSFVQPEVEKLKEEAMAILRSVGLNTDQTEAVCLQDSPDPEGRSSASTRDRDVTARQTMSTAHAQRLQSAPLGAGGRAKGKYRSNGIHRPKSPLSNMADVPETIKSPFLSEVKNYDIWSWIQERAGTSGGRTTDAYS